MTMTRRDKEAPGTLKIQETWINGEKGYIYGKSDWYEPYTDNIGRLFRGLMKEYGRCVSKVYQDTPDGVADPIGWVFQKRQPYTDSPETYLQETWVIYRYV
jgi:hypothetical protein